MSEKRIQTAISTSDEESITIRGKDLTREIVGNFDFGEFVYFHLTGYEPTPTESRMLNAMLVTVVEHGMVPSVIASRLTYDSAPEAVQGAVASGLLGAGSTFLGSMENAAEMLYRGKERRQSADVETIAREIVDERDRLPGFGHPIHEPTDPRTDRLFELLEDEGLAGDYHELVLAIRDVAQAEYKANMPINATGAIGTCVCELGLDPKVGRGLALVSRAAGLVGHVNEEIEEPAAREMWEIVEENTEYTG
jgi:citrate synthase